MIDCSTCVASVFLQWGKGAQAIPALSGSHVEFAGGDQGCMQLCHCLKKVVVLPHYLNKKVDCHTTIIKRICFLCVEIGKWVGYQAADLW